MIVGAGGVIAGTVGGGKVELAAIASAREVAAGGAARRLHLKLAGDLAMCCGGEIDMWVEPLDERRVPALAEVVERRARRLPSALSTALSPSGGKAVSLDDDCLRTRRPRLDGDSFIEPVLPPPRLCLFGGGHVAQALSTLAAGCGFEVVVCEEESSLATPGRFPDAARLVHAYDPGEVARALAPFGRDDYAVILTHDHALDEEVLAGLLPMAELSYLGLLGSRSKLARFRERIAARGFTDDDAWARLHAPVGLAIGADTPEEIAVAIAAELVKVRAGRARS